MITDLPIIKDKICGYLICEVINFIDCGSHYLTIAKVTSSKKESNLIPMTYRYYHEQIKGKAPKKAPTYQEETSSKKESYICKICGYLHEGDMEDDFKCPICGVNKNYFEKKENYN